MAINNKPIFTGTPQINWCINAATGSATIDLTQANNLSGSNGATSGTVGFLCFTANSTNGGYVQKIRFRAKANSGSSTTATAARIWINNGSPLSTSTNNVLFDEITLPATSISATAASANYEIPLNFALPSGYKIFVTFPNGAGTSNNTAWDITVFGGSYVAQT